VPQGCRPGASPQKVQVGHSRILSLHHCLILSRELIRGKVLSSDPLTFRCGRESSSKVSIL
jgi:hypothetical protein